ncbi:hypothetical protein B0H14DRAFT_2652956 [Mycena olivaceomarginata]|nr:hypothetical protein B0H14DRAFT_2652956 [Mycena olivaceomarginata]
MFNFGDFRALSTPRPFRHQGPQFKLKIWVILCFWTTLEPTFHIAKLEYEPINATAIQNIPRATRHMAVIHLLSEGQGELQVLASKFLVGDSYRISDLSVIFWRDTTSSLPSDTQPPNLMYSRAIWLSTMIPPLHAASQLTSSILRTVEMSLDTGERMLDMSSLLALTSSHVPLIITYDYNWRISCRQLLCCELRRITGDAAADLKQFVQVNGEAAVAEVASRMVIFFRCRQYLLHVLDHHHL